MLGPFREVLTGVLVAALVLGAPVRAAAIPSCEGACCGEAEAAGVPEAAEVCCAGSACVPAEPADERPAEDEGENDQEGRACFGDCVRCPGCGGKVAATTERAVGATARTVVVGLVAALVRPPGAASLWGVFHPPRL